MTNFNYIPVIFAGHGGSIEGEYITAPSRMHTFEDGFTVQEGVVNRELCKYLCMFLYDEDMPYFYSETQLDTPLSAKTEIAERCNSGIGKCFLLDIHNNAGKGSGSEIFTSPGRTESDPIATKIINNVGSSMGKEWNLRKGLGDGDPDKERKFYVLINTYLPSVLFEGGFMDTRSDAEVITSKAGQKKLARGIANGILEVNGKKKIPVTRKNPKCEK